MTTEELLSVWKEEAQGFVDGYQDKYVPGPLSSSETILNLKHFRQPHERIVLLIQALREYEKAIDRYSMCEITVFGKIDEPNQIQAVEHLSVWDCGLMAREARDRVRKILGEG